MRKNFQHRYKWFRVFKHLCPDWIGSGYIVHTPRNINTRASNVEVHTYYIESVDELYQISLGDLLKHRAKYNERFHIDRDFLNQIPITDEWRKEIDEYKRKRYKKKGG